jgi:hypothetical protein
MKKLPYFKFYIQDFMAYKDLIDPKIFYQMLISVNYYILSGEHLYEPKNKIESNLYSTIIQWVDESNNNYEKMIEGGKKGGRPKKENLPFDLKKPMGSENENLPHNQTETETDTETETNTKPKTETFLKTDKSVFCQNSAVGEIPTQPTEVCSLELSNKREGLPPESVDLSNKKEHSTVETLVLPSNETTTNNGNMPNKTTETTTNNGNDQTPKNPSQTPKTQAKPTPKPDFSKEMLEIFNQTCPKLPRATQLTPSRKLKLNGLIGNKNYRDKDGKPVFESLEDWKTYCEIANESPFLTGNGNRGWRADLDFLLNPSKIVKIIEGTYEFKKPIDYTNPDNVPL